MNGSEQSGGFGFDMGWQLVDHVSLLELLSFNCLMVILGWRRVSPRSKWMLKSRSMTAPLMFCLLQMLCVTSIVAWFSSESLAACQSYC